jgi:hypothetical protein
MTYSQLFLNLRGKIPPENHCFRPVFELRHSLLREGERNNDSPHPLTGGLAETRRNMKSYHRIPRRILVIYSLHLSAPDFA